MQLELNFDVQDWKETMKECANNFYGILIWMQILANPTR